MSLRRVFDCVLHRDDAYGSVVETYDLAGNWFKALDSIPDADFRFRTARTFTRVAGGRYETVVQRSTHRRTYHSATVQQALRVHERELDEERMHWRGVVSPRAYERMYGLRYAV